MNKVDKKEKVDDEHHPWSKNYAKIAAIGSGTYGTVYKAQNLQTKELVAIKKIKLEVETEGVPSTALREIVILKKIDHPNVVKLMNIDAGDNRLYLFFEYLPYDLRKFISEKYKEKSSHIPIDYIKIIFYQIILGTRYLHCNKVLHRDLKPQNLLIDDSLRIKIADFGLSRGYTIPIRPYTKEVLTLWYRAPELMLGTDQYSTPIDVWSLGCIMAELYTKVPLFCGDSEIDQLYKIFQALGTPSENIWEGVTELPAWNKDFPKWNGGNLRALVPTMDNVAFDLFNRMIVMNPVKRISAKEALDHPYFDGVGNVVGEITSKSSR